jgi:hypothetical protein
MLAKPILPSSVKTRSAVMSVLSERAFSASEVPGNAKSLNWVKIGAAADQNVLNKAQDLANAGNPVLAVKGGRKKQDGTIGPGHVALIIPGTVRSVKFEGYEWGSLKTPNTASFFLDRADRAFVGCPMSAVWNKPDGVSLFFKP